MAENKPFIAARLRNPTEAAVKAKPKQDIIGGVFAIIAFLVTAALLAIVLLDWSGLKDVLVNGSGF